LPGTPVAEREAKLREALRLLKRAARLDPHNGDVRRWSARVLLALSRVGSHAELVQCYFDAKAQLMAAVALNPDDFEAHHLLGALAWDVSQWSWWYRGFLGASVGPAPVESLDGARDQFLRAESIVPRTWPRNMERLAAVHVLLGLVPDGVRWAYATVAECAPPKTWDDVDAVRDALLLLRKHDPAAHAAAVAALCAAHPAAPPGASDLDLARFLAAKAGLKPAYEELPQDAQAAIDQLNDESQAQADALRSQQAATKPQGIRDIWRSLRDATDLGPEPSDLRVAGVAERTSRRA
jgi:hypothetical protein